MLLERIDELPLRHHDLRGNPSALLGAIVRADRPAQGGAGLRRATTRAWAAALPRGRERGAREREFAALYAAHDRLLAEAGALDAGDLVLHAFRLLREQAARARAAGRAATATCWSTSCRTRASPRGCCCGCWSPSTAAITAFADDDQAIHRFRGAATKNVRDFRAEWPHATVVRLERVAALPASGSLAAARAVVEPIEDRLAKELAADARRRGRVLALRQRARAGAGRRGRGRAAGGARGRRARGRLRARALGARRGPGGRASRFEERAVPYRLSGAAAFFQRAEVRDLLAWLRLLVDPGDAGAVVRALARPPVELRAIDLARVTQIARRRKLDMVAALSAALESPQIPPEARERIVNFLKLYRAAAAALDSARPDLYVHRLSSGSACAASCCSRPRPRSSSACRTSPGSPSWPPPTCSRAPQATAREFARSIAAVADAGLREEEAADAGRARRAGDDHARGQGPRVRPRLRARADGRAHARPAPARARADPRRADQGGRSRRDSRAAHAPRCAGCCTWR